MVEWEVQSELLGLSVRSNLILLFGVCVGSSHICFAMLYSRDNYGHFCDTRVNEGEQNYCASSQETCAMHLGDDQQTCPLTCNECPTWNDSNASMLWFILMIISIISPLLVWITLPFLRGENGKKENCHRCYR